MIITVLQPRPRCDGTQGTLTGNFTSTVFSLHVEGIVGSEGEPFLVRRNSERQGVSPTGAVRPGVAAQRVLEVPAAPGPWVWALSGPVCTAASVGR